MQRNFLIQSPIGITTKTYLSSVKLTGELFLSRMHSESGPFDVSFSIKV